MSVRKTALIIAALLALLASLLYTMPHAADRIGAGRGAAPARLESNPDTSTQPVAGNNVIIVTYPERVCAYHPTILFLYMPEKYGAARLVLNVTTVTETEVKPVEAPPCRGSVAITVQPVFENGKPVPRALLLAVDRYTGSVCRSEAPGVVYLNQSSYALVALYDGDGDNLYEYIGVQDAYVTGPASVTITLKDVNEVVSNTLFQYERVTFETSIPVFKVIVPVSPVKTVVLGVTGIPSLPSFLVKADKSALTQHFIGIDPAIDSIYVNLSTLVKLKIVDRFGRTLNQTMIRVARGCRQGGDAPPAAIPMIADYLRNPLLLWNGFLLSTPYWSVQAGASVNVTILAIDDRLVKRVELYYRVNGGPWSVIEARDTPVTRELKSFTSTTFNYYNNTIQIILDAVNYIGGSPPAYAPHQPPVVVEYALIPGQPPGELIEYYARVEDDRNNVYDTVRGLYITYNVSGPYTVLVYDPSMPLYLLRENYENIIDKLLKTPYAESFYYVAKRLFGVDLAEEVEKLAAVYKLASSLVHLHHWEKLAKHYKLFIVANRFYLPRSLTLFLPRVIIISNSWLGFNQSIAPWITDWDLSRYDVLDKILDYVRQMHGGLVVTHASLFDMVAWGDGKPLSPIGAASQADILANAIGLPLLRLYRELRDTVARVYAGGSVGLADRLGSTPTILPYVPWDGRLIVTEEARRMGFTNLASVEVRIPNPFEKLGYKAYTSVGWQLGWPIGVNASKLLSELEERLRKVGDEYKRLFSNVFSALGAQIDVGDILYSTPERLRLLYSLAANATYYTRAGGLVAVVNTTLPGGRERLEIPINGLPVYQLIYNPVKLVAVSPDGLAGIVAYDYYWSLVHGYRAVYISFEIEASVNDEAWKLLSDVIRWAASWSPPISPGGDIVRAAIDSASHGYVGRLLGGFHVTRLGGIVASRMGATYTISTRPGVAALLIYNSSRVRVAGVKGGDLLGQYNIPGGFKLVLIYAPEAVRINVTLASPSVEPVALALVSSKIVSSLADIMPELQSQALDALRSLGSRYYTLTDAMLVPNKTIVEYRVPYRRLVVAIAFNKSLDIVIKGAKHYIIVERRTPVYRVGLHNLVLLAAYLKKGANATLVLSTKTRGLGEPVYIALRSLPAADLNLDGRVDFNDFIMLKKTYGATRGSRNYNWIVDINSDGVIDYRDLAILAAHYGEEYRG